MDNRIDKFIINEYFENDKVKDQSSYGIEYVDSIEYSKYIKGIREAILDFIEFSNQEEYKTHPYLDENGNQYLYSILLEYDEYNFDEFVRQNLDDYHANELVTIESDLLSKYIDFLENTNVAN